MKNLTLLEAYNNVMIVITKDGVKL